MPIFVLSRTFFIVYQSHTTTTTLKHYKQYTHDTEPSKYELHKTYLLLHYKSKPKRYELIIYTFILENNGPHIKGKKSVFYILEKDMVEK